VGVFGDEEEEVVSVVLMWVAWEVVVLEEELLRVVVTWKLRGAPWERSECEQGSLAWA
jgi:hypothetical protein